MIRGSDVVLEELTRTFHAAIRGWNFAGDACEGDVDVEGSIACCNDFLE
jgi:hypothetical protein